MLLRKARDHSSSFSCGEVHFFEQTDCFYLKAIPSYKKVGPEPSLSFTSAVTPVASVNFFLPILKVHRAYFSTRRLPFPINKGMVRSPPFSTPRLQQRGANALGRQA